MSSLDAFMTTWSSARETLGQGTPQEGAPFDKSSQLRQMQTAVQSAAPKEQWTGAAADGYAAANSKQGQVLGQMAGLDQRLGAEVDRSAAVVAAGRQNLDGVKQWVLDAASSVPQGDDREQRLLPIARKGIGDVADVVKQTNGDLNTIGGRIRDIGNEYKQLGGPNDKDPVDKVVDDVPYDTGSEIPVGKDPKEVTKWWNSLPPDKQQQLLRDWPDKLGNLNGIPVEVRDKANQTIMQQDINRPAEVAKARGVSVDEVLAHPDLYGMDGPMMARYNNALQVQKGLEYNKSNTGGTQTYLYVYDPEAFDGKGRAAVAIGNPDTAANTAVVVPGTSHSVTEGWLSQKDAANVYNEAHAADPQRSTSVIAWMGYNAPNSMSDPQVGQTGLAHQGGALLASDVNALASTHQGDPSHVTVIGHSYGSTTVADAAAGYGMRVNDVVLLGCPGTDMAKNAAGFNLAPGGHVYVGGASGDPVSYLGGIGQGHIPGTDITVALGNDPYVDGFGSTRFKAENPSWGLVSDHSHYLDYDSESLFSIGDIAAGHGDALEHDGMTAPHRVRIPGPLPLPEIDPEAAREARGRTHQ